MASKSLNQITRKRLTAKEQINALATALQTEDRITALTSGALIEQMLEAAIRTRLRLLKKKEQDGLFGTLAPLSSFAAKIRVGYALGIFGPRTRDDLNKIREIRNAFAHSIRPLKFTNPQITGRCKSMHYPLRSHGKRDHAQMSSRDLYLAAFNELYLLFMLVNSNKSARPSLVQGLHVMTASGRRKPVMF